MRKLGTGWIGVADAAALLGLAAPSAGCSSSDEGGAASPSSSGAAVFTEQRVMDLVDLTCGAIEKVLHACPPPPACAASLWNALLDGCFIAASEPQELSSSSIDDAGGTGSPAESDRASRWNTLDRGG